jgi:Tol biopolymer transport system component
VTEAGARRWLLAPAAALAVAAVLLAAHGCAADAPAAGGDLAGEPVVPPRQLTIRAGKPVDPVPGEERHIRNVRKLTFGGENAEAYWSFDGTKLIYQSKRKPYDCDQIFVLDLESGQEQMVSTGKGKCTCSYFLRGDRGIIFSSTHLRDPNCPVAGRVVRGRYVWPIFPGFDIFRANVDGSDLQPLTTTDGYDAEGTVCPVTGRIVFTSVRDGDLELYSMEPDGSDVQRLTNREGYDGGAFYSHDGSKIVARSGFFKNDDDRTEYFTFLRHNLILPSQVDIVVMDRDGGNFRRVTDNGAANFAPYWHPDNRRIIFCSNLGKNPNSRNFDLWLVDEDGDNLEQVTFHDTFDGFPMFSPDGKYLAFASNRYGEDYNETSIFVAEWVD